MASAPPFSNSPYPPSQKNPYPSNQPPPYTQQPMNSGYDNGDNNNHYNNPQGGYQCYYFLSSYLNLSLLHRIE